MRDRGMTAPAGAIASRAAVVLAVLFCAAGTLAAAQPPPRPEESDLPQMRSTFDQAVVEFEGPQQGQSIVRFEEIISRLESARRAAGLSDAAQTLLVQSYEYRARAHYNLGSLDRAADGFRALITVRPQHALDANLISPKVVDFFKDIKSKMVGYITVQSIPQGASVSLSGQFLSVTDFFPIEVLAGDYAVEVSKRGYRTESRPAAVVAGETQSLQFDLVRTSATGFVVTEPVGVEVLMNGVTKGVTSGALDPAYASMAAARGLDPAKASSRLELSDLAAGSYTIEFRRPCYEPLRMVLEVPEPQDYEIAPVKLDPSVGTLVVTSDPAGGQIFVDGRPQGVAPRTIEGVCAGSRRVEVRHPFGRFVKDVNLRRAEKLDVAAVARPTLGYLGVLADGPGGARVRDSVDRRVGGLLSSSVTALNVIRIDSAQVARVLESERVELGALLPPSRPDPSLVRRVFEKLAAETEVQGFLLVRIPEDQLIRRADIQLLAAGNVVPDVVPAVAEDEASFRPFLAALERRPVDREPVTGLVTIDTLTESGPVVLRVLPGSPAQKAGIVPGAVVTAAAGKPVASTADLERAVAAAQAGKISLTVAQAATPTTLELPIESAPRELRLGQDAVLYNKFLMDLRQTIDGYPGTDAAAIARLNLGLVALHFRDFAAAHEAFVRARNELGDRPGLNRGTAAFYAGAALEALGYTREALEEYRKAALDGTGTLGGRSGPLVKDVAARRVAALSAGR